MWSSMWDAAAPSLMTLTCLSEATSERSTLIGQYYGGVSFHILAILIKTHFDF